MANAASAEIRISVEGSTTTYITLPTDKNYFFAIIPTTENPLLSDEPPNVPLPVVLVVSTGPVIMKSPTTGDCSQIDYVNPNSTCHATKYVPCP